MLRRAMESAGFIATPRGLRLEGLSVPEGDTVYQAAKRLDRGLTGQVLTSSDFRIPSLATSDISGATVTGTISRGKHLLTRFDNGLTLRTHLKMDGTWQVDPPGIALAAPGPHRPGRSCARRPPRPSASR